MKQRLERALEVAMEALDALANLGGRSSVGNQIAQDILKQIDAILHPVEVVSEEVVRWMYPDCDSIYVTATVNKGCCLGKQLVKLTGTITREKKVVERSVTVEGGITVAGNLLCAGVFKKHPECHGKAGLLTFEWTE